MPFQFNIFSSEPFARIVTGRINAPSREEAKSMLEKRHSASSRNIKIEVQGGQHGKVHA